MLRKNKNNQGFTLIELMLASSIFAVILGTIILYGVRALQAQTKSRAMQNSLDNARFAMEGINKRVRTSNHVANNAGRAETYSSGGSDDLFVIDNIDGAHYCYLFHDNGTFKGLYAAKDFDSLAATTKCSEFTNFPASATVPDDDYWRLIAGSENVSVDGKFYMKTTTGTQRGLITTVMDIQYNQASGSVEEKDSIKLQTTVSSRDYEF